MNTCIVLGGGAAGLFAAIAAAEAAPKNQVLLLEKTNTLLAKVRISGGGRCNVTHACFDPKSLVKNYPRGNKALLGPFTRFQPLDTIEWFKQRGVGLKTEADGRMFPITDHSQTIIDCLLNAAHKAGVEIRKNQRINSIIKSESGFILHLDGGCSMPCSKILLATGSHPHGHQIAQSLGHSIIPPVPSLFTFNIPSSTLHELSGISAENVGLQIVGTDLEQSGPLLITHWGFSGPAALKLSAWGARYLHEHNYAVKLAVNWTGSLCRHEIQEILFREKQKHPATNLSYPHFGLPRNLWKKLLEDAGVDPAKKLANFQNRDLQRLTDKLHADIYQVEGKTTYKQEFVTCGGVNLDEVNFKRMESRLCPGLFFAGEVLDIDGVTGGFNFQSAWTTAWIAGHALSE